MCNRLSWYLTTESIIPPLAVIICHHIPGTILASYNTIPITI
ncbi:hypothetical protein ETA_05040 [Erwinia tasmaniensis Et1/99]|uniref:Uncharacterized protein n=1 Tax=Erwinia tasmaniensis (strain DSM 17950 / CFBP 7177 / CIP 109463 / NCPPB 4357 / Et1/99) TaxID=465817 RepID=B2VGD6_ERWT9|nr:hypothetical protein ETA_05040 [Erwinia tasmaniensis Et1/99]